MFTDETDGIDHINIYSKGKTNLGRFLSNFTRHPIDTEDGRFDSIEGYWYWLGCEDDKLRRLSGWEAKKYGRSVRASDWNDDEEFKRKIKDAITKKIITADLKGAFTNSDLPFDHYYVYGGKVVRPKEGQWIIDHITQTRSTLKMIFEVLQEIQDERNDDDEGWECNIPEDDGRD